MKHSMILCGMLIFTCSCQKELKHLPIPYDGDKLVVFAYISNVNGLNISIRKSMPPTGSYSFDTLNLNVTNAKGYLFENGMLIDSIKFISGPNYTTVHPFFPVSGNEYSITLSASGYPDVQSETVLMPDVISFSSIIAPSGFINVNGNPSVHIMPIGVDNAANAQNYLFRIATFPPGASAYNSQQNFVMPENLFPDCGPFRIDPVSYNDFVFSDQCFSGKSFPFYFDVSLAYQIDTITGNFNKIIFNYGATSDSYLNYLKTYPLLEGIDLLFVKPNITYSNIHNGYGILWTENLNSIEFNF